MKSENLCQFVIWTWITVFKEVHIHCFYHSLILLSFLLNFYKTYRCTFYLHVIIIALLNRKLNLLVLWKVDKTLKKEVFQNGEFMPNLVPNFSLALLWNLILSLMYRLLNNSQIARATMGHRTRMTTEGTGTSLRWYTWEAWWLHPTWDSTK